MTDLGDPVPTQIDWRLLTCQMLDAYFQDYARRQITILAQKAGTPEAEEAFKSGMTSAAAFRDRVIQMLSGMPV
jgi:hypothetical protein